MKTKEKAVLIDLFGTLCGRTSPEERIMKMWNLPESSYESLQRAVCGTKFNGDIKDFYLTVLDEAGVEVTENSLERLSNIFRESIKDGVVFPDTIRVLETLSSRYQLGLVSNANPFVRTNILDKNGLTKYFDSVMLSYEIGTTKQSPDIYKKALEDLKVSPENAVMIGDDFEGDILSSKRATLCSIGGILISNNPYLVGQGRFTAVPRLSYVPEAVEKYFSEGRF